MNILHNRSIDRRTFLRGAGVALALPWLECMSSQTRSALNAGGISENERPRRAIFCMWGMGVNGRQFTPEQTGRNYELTPILRPLEQHRQDFTIISGLKLTHSGGHGGDRTFLTGTNTHRGDSRLRISCDQELAAAIGNQTRYPSLVLGIKRGTGFGNPQDNTLSWTQSGTPIPSENRPNVLFDRLFRSGSPEAVAAQRNEAARTRSVLDAVREEANQLSNNLGKGDRERLDQYFNSVRDVESRIQTDLRWLDVPRPQVEPPNFGDDVQALDPELRGGRNFDYRRYQRLMFDVITLALQTDSTRVISYMPRMDLRDGTYCYGFMGCPYGYHEMTHHGEEADKLRWLTRVDTWYSEDWAYFINKLKSIREGDGRLLDNTLLVWGSSGGTINAHHNTNLPTMMVGGSNLGIRHQGHIRKQDVLLGNLWQTMFGVLGVPVPENFQGGEANGTISEIVA